MIPCCCLQRRREIPRRGAAGLSIDKISLRPWRLGGFIAFARCHSETIEPRRCEDRSSQPIPTPASVVKANVEAKFGPVDRPPVLIFSRRSSAASRWPAFFPGILITYPFQA
jgi:hypothetical protein